MINGTLLKLIVWRSLSQHRLATMITILSVALASGLTISVFSIQEQTRQAFVIEHSGFDAVLGARGSELQLVMNCVYHLETSPGNLKWEFYEAMKKEPSVALAVPYAVGDNYHGFRIVGTTPELFQDFQYRKGEHFQCQPGGRFFGDDHHEVVVGNFVANKLKLKVGDVIHPYHGLEFDPQKKHRETFRVVGVLAATNTPSDRVLWVPIESVFRMEGHVLRGSGEEYQAQPDQVIPDEHKEVSAVMLKFKSPFAGMKFYQLINRQGREATLAFPIAKVMFELFEKIGWVNRVLEFVAYLVVLVAAGGIMASLTNTMAARRREFAILRALGARRSLLFGSILLQSSIIALVGCLLGMLVHLIIFSIAAQIIQNEVGVYLSLFTYHDILWICPLLMLLLGMFAGLLPAIQAYRSPVISQLSPLT